MAFCSLKQTVIIQYSASNFVLLKSLEADHSIDKCIPHFKNNIKNNQ